MCLKTLIHKLSPAKPVLPHPEAAPDPIKELTDKVSGLTQQVADLKTSQDSITPAMKPTER